MPARTMTAPFSIVRRAAALAGAAAVVAWTAGAGCDRAGAPDAAALSDLVADIAAGRAAAVERAKQAAARDWPAAAPTVVRMLGHEHWRVRATACTILAEHPDPTWLAAVFPRAADADWRVRAAALTVLARHGGRGGPPTLRDSPLEDREAWLLEWLDAHDEHTPAALGPDLCELVAGARNVEFGRTLVGRCLWCHAGASPAPFAASDACRRCHGEVHGAWSASAHAQSLTHLDLATIDAATREPVRMDFGEVRGIGCTECHRTAGPLPTAATEGSPRGEACPFAFDVERKAADSCVRCHATTHQEWEAWRGGCQPRRAVFPPGQIDLDHQGDERDCIACHMQREERGGAKALPRHDWAARRNRDLLRSGIDLASVRTRDDAGRTALRLTLTNLAGHAYPTGTRRRAVRLLAGAEGGLQVLIAAFSPLGRGAPLGGAQPALAPGEQREFTVPLPQDASGIAYRLLYVRDVTNPEGYTLEVLSGSNPVGSWFAP